MADRDQIALDAATKIMDLVYGQMPVGGSVQLKAGVQVVVAEALATQPPAVGVDVSEQTVRRIARAVADWASVAGDPEPDDEMMDELCDTVTAALRTGGGE